MSALTESQMLAAAEPVGDRLMVYNEVGEVYPGGISPGGVYLPDTVEKEIPQCGVVHSVGKGKLDPDGRRIPIGVEAGDTILFSKYAGSDVEIDGTQLIVIKECDVLLRIPAEAVEGMELPS